MYTMCKYLIGIFLVFFFYSCNGKPNNEPVELKVMSFNIWIGGGKSIPATAQVIIDSKADIVGVQEAIRDGKNIAAYIADSIGWYSYKTDRSPSIISKYPIVDTSFNKNGVKIKISDDRFVWMFNIHLMYCPYEPYQLNGIEYCGGPLLQTAEQAVESAMKSRGEEVNMIIADILEAQKEGYPIFLTGDFNEPSCLDWTQRAAEAGLCKLPVEWPSTNAFIQKGGMTDSYRVIYPDEVLKPGHTWTPLPETEAYTEVLDRIDFVMFRGDKVELVNSQIVGEKSNKSDIGFDNYPSDHRAVLSTFILE